LSEDLGGEEADCEDVEVDRNADGHGDDVQRSHVPEICYRLHLVRHELRFGVAPNGCPEAAKDGLEGDSVEGKELPDCDQALTTPGAVDAGDREHEEDCWEEEADKDGEGEDGEVERGDLDRVHEGARACLAGDGG